ncbi:MAG TPA: hypothetical protein PLB57_02390, partial [bacterium]|nr:hypothetical protein [bacterium]
MRRKVIFYSILTLILILSNYYLSFSQLEAKHWVFGQRVHLKFENAQFVKMPASKVLASGGTACISDKNGDLLFYTDGKTIWNKNHDTLKNGYGLISYSGSTQGAIIIPMPDNPHYYYIITVNHNFTNDTTKGLYYHIVDITRDNGNGEVIVKNRLICKDISLRLSAVYHANKKSVWILVHEYNSNIFKTFLLSNKGLDTIPVISQIGSVQSGYNMNVYGQIKFSSSGKLVALPITWDGKVEIFEFDNASGKISKQISTLELLYLGPSSQYFHPYIIYGIEFSPNEKYLYVSCFGYPSGICQIDVSSGIDSIIRKSATMVYKNYKINADPYFSLQIGLDKKIYVARPPRYLGCINKPDETGVLCNYVDSAIYFPPGGPPYINITNGLPTFLQSYFYLPDIEIKNT